MRTIKFRAWDKERKQFEIFTLIQGGWVLSGAIEKKSLEMWQQFTGLLDKNGVEIYEGDVVKKRNGNISEVRFGEYCFTGGEYSTQGIGFYLYTSEDKGMFGQYDFPTKSVEVIGNIYQNPELLAK